jgi:hypothetical protein
VRQARWARFGWLRGLRVRRHWRGTALLPRFVRATSTYPGDRGNFTWCWHLSAPSWNQTFHQTREGSRITLSFVRGRDGCSDGCGEDDEDDKP